MSAHTTPQLGLGLAVLSCILAEHVIGRAHSANLPEVEAFSQSLADSLIGHFCSIAGPHGLGCVDSEPEPQLVEIDPEQVAQSAANSVAKYLVSWTQVVQGMHSRAETAFSSADSDDRTAVDPADGIDVWHPPARTEREREHIERDAFNSAQLDATWRSAAAVCDAARSATFGSVRGDLRHWRAAGDAKTMHGDPRLSSWYSVSASVPKDVVLIGDLSWSMTQNNALAIAKAAALAVNGLSKPYPSISLFIINGICIIPFFYSIPFHQTRVFLSSTIH